MTLPPERPGYPAPAIIQSYRDASTAAIAQRIWRAIRTVETLTLGGVELLRVTPKVPAPRARVLHLHGGGFRMGMPEMDAPYAEALADRCGVELLLPRYRLAPEHPFPAGLNDAHAVFAALDDDLPVILSGASAGGGLAAGLAVLAAKEGRRPAGLVLHSAWLDLRVDARSYTINGASDPLFSRDSAAAAAELYLQGSPPDNPLASPLLANAADYPPTLITVGSGEVLLDDATRLADRLDAKARLLVVDGMEHVAVTRSLEAVGGAEVFAATVGFIDELLT